MTGNETTPLIARVADDNIDANGNNDQKKGLASWFYRIFDVENRILFAGLIITLSFSFTQVPLFYAVYLMECDDYYTKHPPYQGSGDRCSVDEINSGTATQFSILAMSSTFCGTLNLFLAGWTVKKVGPRLALLAQIFVPAIRVACQIVAVAAGGRAGIVIFQATQIVTIFGGPVGYILIINIIVGEVVKPARRTIVFGLLQGCFMLGSGTGLLTGGKIGGIWGVRRPFDVAFVAFLISTVYARFAMPYISPASMGDGAKPQVKGIAGFFAPLKVISSQRITLRSGVTRKHLGVLFLCLGVFIGVLATDYTALLIQLYATTYYHFDQNDSGWLMSEFSFMRAFFLLFVFPRVISTGRKWHLSRHPNKLKAAKQSKSQAQQEEDAAAEFPTHPEQLDAPVATQAGEEPISAEPLEGKEDTAFDLFFLRSSLVLDGLLTMCVAFTTQKWHIYLAAGALPFASGTAPAAKGVLTAMVSSSQRADALNALTLIENIGRLLTMGLFGFIFAALSEAHKPHLTFFCNAAIALIASGVLLFCTFPPEGSRLVEDVDQNGDEGQAVTNGTQQGYGSTANEDPEH
ncbi:major facilitator superfamily domain-containing protein [Podospora didyma]|uniref:Major facilitator superfamily domain-containing protein n=1 Tax=Podospora didyma TaxID=330526 RepID=A0AAE0K1S7_9PEZI|nr:major facilitator superfamily domain-containing protein [Podospora didyma]